jgi:cyanophycinase
MEVVGSGAVVIVDGRDILHSNITEVKLGEPIAVENLKVSIMVRGNQYLLKERKFIANMESVS